MTTILLVENETVLLEMLQELLRKQGYTVLTAPSGEFAVRLCHQLSGAIDVLICDVGMAGMNGFQIAAAVKSIFPDVLVLLMSSSPRDVFPESNIAHQFFEKPFPHRELLAAIARHASRLTPAGGGS